MAANDRVIFIKTASDKPARRTVKFSDFDGLDEANVAAEFYHQCKVNGLRAYLEVSVRSVHHRSGKFRVDCIVVDRDGASICAVEFKTAGARPGRGQSFKAIPVSGSGKQLMSRQARAYSDLGIPWRYCIGKKDIPATIEWTLSLVEPED